MKLKVYQQGGGLIYTPFIPEAIGTTSSSKASSDNEEDAKIDPLDKELLSLMKDQNLLPSDIQMIFNRLIAFQKKTQRLSELSTFGGTDSYRSVMPGMLQIMNLTSIAKNNKEHWDTSLAEIKKHNAGSEVAMDSYGRIWVASEDGIKKIELSDFDSEKHQPISNSQLLYYRQRNPSMAFQDDIFEDTWMDVVGMDDVRKEIYDIIDKFGTIKSAEFQKQKFKNIAEDLQGEGIYKITTKYSKADLNDFSGLLYSQLSREARNLINANAKIGGFEPEDFIRSIISSQTDVEVDPTYEASLTKANSLSSEGGSEQWMHDTYPERLTTGEDVVGHWEVIQTDASGHKIYAYAQDMGPIMKNGNGIGTVNFDKVLTEFDASGIIDWQHTSFGDNQLNTIDFPKVVYDGGSMIKRVWLPVNQDGTVDFEAQKQLSTLQNWINENGVINDALIEERVSEIPDAVWDKETKTINFIHAKPFLVVKGVVSSDKVRFNTDSKYVFKMERGEGNPRKDWMTIYNNAISTGTSTEGKAKYDYGKAAGRHLYEGNVFMPITNQTIGALIYNQQVVPKSRYMDIRNTAETSEKAIGFKGNYDG